MTAPATAQGSWLLADALRRCEDSCERVERAIAALAALDAACVWRARAVDRLREGLSCQREEMLALLPQLRGIAADLAGERAR